MLRITDHVKATSAVATAKHGMNQRQIIQKQAIANGMILLAAQITHVMHGPVSDCHVVGVNSQRRSV